MKYLKHIKSIRFKESAGKMVLIGIGALAFVWFLIRVIPKPGRAAYPCQKAAFPLATGFIIWLTGVIASLSVIKKAISFFKRKRYLTSTIVLTVGLGLFLFSSYYIEKHTVGAASLQVANDFEPTDRPNEPIGKARGIFPGRVVWSHNPNATSWNGQSTSTPCDGISSATTCWKSKNAWWNNLDMNEVKTMLDNSIQTLAGIDDLEQAWDGIFRNFNTERNSEDRGYQNGEKIAIKVNLNTVGGHEDESNACYVSPQLVLALLEHLVENAGVNPAEITIYDISRPMPVTIFGLCKGKYPEIVFVDSQGGNGRKKFELDENVEVHWSENLVLENGGGYPTYLPKCVTEANYLINLTNLKGHDLTGVTVCAKNHFGTICTKEGGSAPQKAGVHPYVAVHDFGNPGGGGKWDFYGREMNSYNALVDLMTHPHVGEKTLLFIVDAFYTVRRQNNDVTIDDKWQMLPFNNDWPSSLFVSQDGVAIESVGLDFLRSEPTQFNVTGNVDNYLHEAALAYSPPSGVVYQPSGNQVVKSPGVHEHWNNSIDKQYSRNLSTGDGIELIKADNITGLAQEIGSTINFKIYPNPVTENYLWIESSYLENSNETYIQIFDMNGKIVFNKDITFNSTPTIKIDVTNVVRQNNSVYHLRVMVRNKIIGSEQIVIF
jgi:uncharacterized protein (DUF362 family)